MASELIVQTLKGPTSGANANKILLGSGQELYAPGHVIQVVSTSSATYQEISSTTLTDTALTVTITPSSTSSKIFVTTNVIATLIRAANDRIGGKVKVLRDSTTIVDADTFQRIGAGTDSIGENFLTIPGALTYLDSPSTTSAVTYKVQLAASKTTNSGRIRLNSLTSPTNPSNITVMEIAG